MTNIDKLQFYNGYINRIIIERSKEKIRKEYTDMYLQDNISVIDTGRRPKIFDVNKKINVIFGECLLVLTSRQDEILVFFDDDLVNVDTDSLKEIKNSLNEKLKRSNKLL